MTHKTTIELTRGEMTTLWAALTVAGERLDEAFAKGERDGWYDAKAKEKVSVAFWQTYELTKKLQQVIKEMDQ
jgi:hypothetical protein